MEGKPVGVWERVVVLVSAAGLWQGQPPNISMMDKWITQEAMVAGLTCEFILCQSLDLDDYFVGKSRLLSDSSPEQAIQPKQRVVAATQRAIPPPFVTSCSSHNEDAIEEHELRALLHCQRMGRCWSIVAYVSARSQRPSFDEEDAAVLERVQDHLEVGRRGWQLQHLSGGRVPEVKEHACFLRAPVKQHW